MPEDNTTTHKTSQIAAQNAAQNVQTQPKKPRRAWSERRRKEQAERCRANKPWLNATGPRTEAGKKAVSMNALKHGARSAAFNALRKALNESAKQLTAQEKLIYYASIGFAHTNKVKETSIKSVGVPPTPKDIDEQSEGRCHIK
tara:strand:+ start:458 stop:889 length:432 start_codon:yes stop_codon:yes gene_type:complete